MKKPDTSTTTSDAAKPNEYSVGFVICDQDSYVAAMDRQPANRTNILYDAVTARPVVPLGESLETDEDWYPVVVTPRLWQKLNGDVLRRERRISRLMVRLYEVTAHNREETIRFSLYKYAAVFPATLLTLVLTETQDDDRVVLVKGRFERW